MTMALLRLLLCHWALIEHRGGMKLTKLLGVPTRCLRKGSNLLLTSSIDGVAVGLVISEHLRLICTINLRKTK